MQIASQSLALQSYSERYRIVYKQKLLIKKIKEKPTHNPIGVKAEQALQVRLEQGSFATQGKHNIGTKAPYVV